MYCPVYCRRSQARQYHELHAAVALHPLGQLPKRSDGRKLLRELRLPTPSAVAAAKALPSTSLCGAAISSAVGRIISAVVGNVGW